MSTNRPTSRARRPLLILAACLLALAPLAATAADDVAADNAAASAAATGALPEAGEGVEAAAPRQGRYSYTRDDGPDTLADGQLVRSAIALSLIVLALGGAAALIIRLTAGRRAGAKTAGRGLRKVASLGLGGRDSVHVVRLGDQLLVLGTGGGGPQLLSTLEGERADKLEAEVGSNGFSAWLSAAAKAEKIQRIRLPRRRETHPQPPVTSATAEALYQ